MKRCPEMAFRYQPALEDRTNIYDTARHGSLGGAYSGARRGRRGWLLATTGGEFHGRRPGVAARNRLELVARASSPAGFWGVSLQVRSGGETPPEPAAGTAALRGSWIVSTVGDRASWPGTGWWGERTREPGECGEARDYARLTVRCLRGPGPDSLRRPLQRPGAGVSPSKALEQSAGVAVSSSQQTYGEGRAKAGPPQAWNRRYGPVGVVAGADRGPPGMGGGGNGGRFTLKPFALAPSIRSCCPWRCWINSGRVMGGADGAGAGVVAATVPPPPTITPPPLSMPVRKGREGRAAELPNVAAPAIGATDPTEAGALGV